MKTSVILVRILQMYTYPQIASRDLETRIHEDYYTPLLNLTGYEPGLPSPIADYDIMLIDVNNKPLFDDVEVDLNNRRLVSFAESSAVHRSG